MHVMWNEYTVIFIHPQCSMRQIDTYCFFMHLYIYKYKNEVGCRDDTMPKTGDTRRHCEVELTVCNNLPQPPKNEM